jgi:CYTH domain-containing protein
VQPADYLAQRMRSAADEAARPKYTHPEIERRWLLDPPVAEKLDLDQPIQILDRYIEGTWLRLRRMSQAGETVWKLTRKYECDDPIARPIVTAYLTAEEHAIFSALPALILEKTRFRLRHRALDFSIDRFAGPLEGLWTAEVELADVDQLRAIEDPPWALRDITQDIRYQGATLARSGIPKGS